MFLEGEAWDYFIDLAWIRQHICIKQLMIIQQLGG
ncbi:hypothetical protein SCG7109_AM_00040 [Chlamydiales bacterium SCGC AG-110-M15]|nr:hypothetical protein SCG7109_AM_00040 [Chlamydiales bacterium SCGC AG-110-M15]